MNPSKSKYLFVGGTILGILYWVIMIYPSEFLSGLPIPILSAVFPGEIVAVLLGPLEGFLIGACLGLILYKVKKH